MTKFLTPSIVFYNELGDITVFTYPKDTMNPTRWTFRLLFGEWQIEMSTNSYTEIA